VKVGRIQNFRSWSPEMVPNPEQSCLGLEYFCFEGDGLWAAGDEELLELAKRELAQIGLADESAVKDGCVVRQKKAYPVYDDAYKANVETARAELAKSYPTLHLVGRNGMHKHNNQDHAMMTAMLTVKNIIAGQALFDVWNANEGLRRPRATNRLPAGRVEPTQGRRCPRGEPGRRLQTRCHHL
jgi:protoporphyrinogen oxidase